MFTAGLELLTCAAELSDPTCPSLGRCLGGVGGGTQSCSADPVCRKAFLLGRWRDGYSCFSPGLVCPKKSASHPLPASSPAKKQYK